MMPNQGTTAWLFLECILLSAMGCLEVVAQMSSGVSTTQRVGSSGLVIEASPQTGSYAVWGDETRKVGLQARVAAQVDHKWLRSDEYPRHELAKSAFTDELDGGEQLTVTNTGAPDRPDLVYEMRKRSQPAFAEVRVFVRNTTGKPIQVQGFRVLEAVGEPLVRLNGPDAANRVLSDSFSEDRPNMRIYDLVTPSVAMHRAVGSQLIYNRESKQSLLVAALSSERWLTVLRLHVNPDERRITGYEVDSTGTTELTKENSLQDAPTENQIELSLPLEPGATLPAEPLMISFGSDYHAQLEAYGNIIRRLHHARVSAPTPMGWWSWTAYYFGINQDVALTNAKLLSQNLKDLGYTFFHLDEGYQYSRGEYTTPDAFNFPQGVKAVEDKARAMGLVPGIWTAPFEVSERSAVYRDHKDWLVHNAAGAPIHAGYVLEEGKQDPLYILDTTHPGAQDYLRLTYSTLTDDWGIRYIKLDFMDDSAVEGFYHRPNTTALEAQRIGLQVIREAVGEGVLLDKDGSPMLNPVGLVDTGRISCDTGHTFESSKEAAPGIAARYYMNRNFFVSDPDAFTVSRQTVDEQEWHGGKRPLTLDEARVSIALSAVSGGMDEIGDDLGYLFADPDRVALVKNRDLINMVRLGQASIPLDLMSYSPEDGMPSVFFLRQNPRQAILTIFNWTDKPRQHRIATSDLGLSSRELQVSDVLNPSTSVSRAADAITLDLAPRSVSLLKLIDPSVAPVAPALAVSVPPTVEVGKDALFSAKPEPGSVPVTACRWSFGDGTSAEGKVVTHTYTRADTFTAKLACDGLDGIAFEKSFPVTAVGHVDTRFTPSRNRRPGAD